MYQFPYVITCFSIIQLFNNNVTDIPKVLRYSWKKNRSQNNRSKFNEHRQHCPRPATIVTKNLSMTVREKRLRLCVAEGGQTRKSEELRNGVRTVDPNAKPTRCSLECEIDTCTTLTKIARRRADAMASRERGKNERTKKKLMKMLDGLTSS